jgi:hypothetical protein
MTIDSSLLRIRRAARHGRPIFVKEVTPMGDLAATASIDRVLSDHSDDLKHRLMEGVPVALQNYVEPVLENHTYSVRVVWLFRGMPGMDRDQCSYLDGPDIDIEALAEDFPCCQVGY